ncbi:uncharacterized protein TNCV_1726881 [Trichonephila clavipes]|nr:uncharacterized protein TNCV_1726881 [Trichonephila clavipes]
MWIWKRSSHGHELMTNIVASGLRGLVPLQTRGCDSLVVKILDYGWFITTTRGLLATDHVILNHGQVTWTTSELASPLLTTTPHQWEDVSALDSFSVHRCPTRRVFSGTGLELVTSQATIRYLYHSATAATLLPLKYRHVRVPSAAR